ncbi:MAG TPA: ATP-dependent Clp protease adaptor ClpS [Bryobacteraceae bacterium]|jgi:ATP-dependent Clp protease adaptor protein ClpS|nr:ATP-dependent Clp protease adaptor ClpS [Bryobacteraceae bacterium]
MPPATTLNPSTTKDTHDQHAPLYNVVLLNDDDHTAEYVIEMLEKLFAIGQTQAWKHVIEVDSTGRTIVVTCDLPVAEFGRDQIHAFGADRRIPRCKGSMSATVEPCTD